jgi:hypothetical protein
LAAIEDDQAQEENRERESVESVHTTSANEVDEQMTTNTARPTT